MRRDMLSSVVVGGRKNYRRCLQVPPYYKAHNLHVAVPSQLSSCNKSQYWLTTGVRLSGECMVCSSGKTYSLQQAASQAEAISTDEESTLDDRVEFLHPAFQAFFGSPVLFPRAANAMQSSMACRPTESLPASNANR